MTDRIIAGLLRERDGYARRGLADRVAQVDEQLALHGHIEPDTDAAPGDLGDPAPDGRTADPGQQSADAPGPDADGKRGRGRPRLPRDGDGNVIRD